MAGNLGFYQTFTTAAGKFGGPVKLLGTIVGGALVIGGVAGAGIKTGYDKLQDSRAKRAAALADAPIFTATSEGSAGGGLTLHVGDRFRVAARDGESILIDMLGENGGQFYVSAEFLQAVSDFRDEA